MADTRLAVSGSSSIPPFEQIRRQLAGQIADGVLAAGSRLPTVRRLAAELGLAANTIARAYRELESAGLVETRGRAGTVVTAGGSRVRERLQAEAQRYAATVHELGVDPDEALRVVRNAVDDACYGIPES
jgi:DNA-binding transcriptional regulator YhcF (GntR family)